MFPTEATLFVLMFIGPTVGKSESIQSQTTQWGSTGLHLGHIVISYVYY